MKRRFLRDKNPKGQSLLGIGPRQRRGTFIDINSSARREKSADSAAGTGGRNISEKPRTATPEKLAFLGSPYEIKVILRELANNNPVFREVEVDRLNRIARTREFSRREINEIGEILGQMLGKERNESVITAILTFAWDHRPESLKEPIRELIDRKNLHQDQILDARHVLRKL